MDANAVERLTLIESRLRTVPDFPKPGINFYDVTSVFGAADSYRAVIDTFTERYQNQSISHVAGIEARGFVLASALALTLDAALVLVRKAGKLPGETLRKAYSLEYGEDAIEIHRDTVASGDRVLLVDDLIATGGTASAAVELLQEAGTEVVEAAFFINLSNLGGMAKLSVPCWACLEREG